MLVRTQQTLDRYAAPARVGALLGCLLFAVLLGLDRVPLAVDAHAYWAANPIDPYNFGALYTQDAYFYSPAFTQALGPLHGLPWPAFAALWTVLLTVVLAWLGGRWFAWVLLVPFVAIELAMGNIHILMAAAIVVGFRRPAAWAFILLTKVTPGVGLIWFAVRREWRALAIAAAVTVGIGAISFAFAPSAWSEWVDVIRATQASTYRESTPLDFIPLPFRVVAAAGLVAWAGLTDRRWIVPIAATLALPVVYINGLALLVAAPYLWTIDRRNSADADRPDPEPAAVAPAGAAPSLPR